jgi:hypothetical protein
MFITVTDTTDLPLAVTVTLLSVIVLVVSLIIGLLSRFRAHIYNIQGNKGSSEPTLLVGVYRGQSFEAASAAPKVQQPANATASSAAHKFQQPPSSKQVPQASSSSGHRFKTDSKKKYPASPPENPLVGQLQSSASKQDNEDRNKSKHQSATSKNPLARLDRHDKRAEKPPQRMGQNKKPKNRAPVPVSILHTELPPPPVTHNGNSSLLELNYVNHTSRRLTDYNRTSPREIDNTQISLKPGHGGPTTIKSKTPIPQYVTDQDESESET